MSPAVDSLRAPFRAKIPGMEAGTLATEFLVRVAEPLRSALAARPNLSELLVERSRSAREKWPTVTVDDQRFWAFVADRLPEDGDDESLDRLCTDDLYVACACVDGIERALLAVDQTVFPAVDNAIANICKDKENIV